MSGGNSAAANEINNIITYVGVPLAVLGVLPIIYNTVATLVSLSRIRRMLRQSRITALTHSDVFNRIIEIRLPRYAVMPWDRFDNVAEYWTLPESRSLIPGGSWTTFHWQTHLIGTTTQRVEYADQARQPQAEVGFDDLASYLLDLGAVVEPRGWKLLRSAGLWTPVGCVLMTSPDGRERALFIAPSDDSDGKLSLAVAWYPWWTTRDASHLPPHCVRLPATTTARAKAPPSGEDGSEPGKADVPVVVDTQSPPGPGRMGMRRTSDDPSLENAIVCEISSAGLASAVVYQRSPRSQRGDQLDRRHLAHAHLRPGTPIGTWFASAATAYGTAEQAVLWKYEIPGDILAFAGKETLPCGIMVLLGMADASETPAWETKHNDQGAALDDFARRSQEQRAALSAEARMSPEQRARAAQERLRRENDARLQQVRDKMRLEQQRRDQRLLEALQSPQWGPALVADRCQQWLHRHDDGGLLRDGAPCSRAQAVGVTLHRMVADGEFASAVCGLLDRWRAWGGIGGMKRSDYEAVAAAKAAFAHAALLLALIAEASSSLSSPSLSSPSLTSPSPSSPVLPPADTALAMDVQACLQLWKVVRLG